MKLQTSTQTSANEQAQAPSIPRRRVVMALLLTLIGVPLVALGCIEIFFQAFMPVTDVPYHIWDPILGPRHPPDLEGRYIYGEEIDARFHFNAQGWNHADDYETQKPPSGRRVCIVGDSMIEALQVDPEQSMFVHAAKVMSRPDRPVQWYAFGVSGWGTSHETAAIRHYLLEYNPDTVVLMFVQNDPMDSSPFVPRSSELGARFELDDDGDLIHSFPLYWKPSPIRRFMSNFALVRYFAIQKRILDRWKLRNQKIDEDVPLRLEAIESQRGNQKLLEKREQQRQIWDLIEALLAECNRNCQQHGAQFVVTFRGNYKQLDAIVRGESYEPPDVEVDPYCMGQRFDEMGREFVEPICRRLGIPYLDLTETLRTEMASKGRSHHFSDDVHYNADAHKVVAEALSEWVESLWAEKAEPQ